MLGALGGKGISMPGQSACHLADASQRRRRPAGGQAPVATWRHQAVEFSGQAEKPVYCSNLVNGKG